MAYSGGGVLRDVDIDQQESSKSVYLVYDENGTDGDNYALCDGYPEGWQTCNPANPVQLLDAEISFTGVTDTTVNNPWYPQTGPAHLPFVVNPSITQCPS